MESIIKGLSVVQPVLQRQDSPSSSTTAIRIRTAIPATKGSHGTHVASTAAGTCGRQRWPCMGVAPQAQIVNMNVFKSSGGASYSDILSALEDCILLGVDVANLSLGSDCRLHRL
ncbi:MAG: S8 family serine peptidase [Dysosmobacter sp.]